MATMFDYWEGDATSNIAVTFDATTDYAAQTFTASASYYAVSAKFWCAKTPGEDIGTVTVSIRAVDGTGHPIGSDLATGTRPNADIPDTSAYAWIEFTFTTGVNLVSGTKYAIVCRASNVSAVRKFYLVDEGDNPLAGGNEELSTNSGSTWAATTLSDILFSVWGDAPKVTDKVYSRKLVAIGNNEVWYESTAGTMVELSDANGQVNCGSQLTAIEAFQKIFIANKLQKKVADFINTKIATTDAGLNPCTFGMTLTGGTSTAAMVVDYVTGVTDDAAMTVYGFRTTTSTFSTGETVTGTNSAGNAVSFVLSANEVGPPHWYTWTTFGQDTTNFGTLLTQPTLICLYRGRIVLAGDSLLPHAWQMTRVGNPWKVLYDFSNDADLSAVTYTNTKVGLIGDIITALIPYKDDLLIFGCANSIWILIGDPLSEGQIVEVTHDTGIWGPRAWCIDNQKNLYFLGNDGIYQMPVGETANPPTNISKIKLPKLITDLDLDKSLHRVVLSFDPADSGIIVSKTLLSDGTNTNYFFSLLTQGWFPESYPLSCGIFSSYYYPATDETYKKFLVGCTDGYIREFDGATKNDTTTASTTPISSYCTIIQQIGESEDKKGMLRKFTAITAGGASGGDFSDTDSVSYELHKGNDAETVLEDIKDGATAFASGTWSTTGKQNKTRPRMGGVWAGIKLYNSTASKTWAIEKLFGDIIPKGQV